MKFELGDNVTLLLLACALGGVVISAGSCLLKVEQMQRAERKAHIDAGHCQDKWGIWSKCR